MTIDPDNARTIGDITVRRGRFEAFRLPGTNDDGTAAMITQLDVPHDGSITIGVTPRDGSRFRIITLHPGTEIAIVNASRRVVQDNDNHFKIYSELVVGHPDVDDPPPTPTGYLRSQSTHGIFRRPNPIGSSARCSSTGCCP